MSQLDALDFALTPYEPRPRVPSVRAVSIAQYVEGREHLKGRMADTLRWLAWFYNRHLYWPTAAELERAIVERDGRPRRFEGPRDMTLYIRKGVSGLQDEGIVRANSERTCKVSGRQVTAWEVIPVGR